MSHILAHVLNKTFHVPRFAAKELKKMHVRGTHVSSFIMSDCYHALCARLANSCLHVAVVTDVFTISFTHPRVRFDVVVLIYDTDTSGASAFCLIDVLSSHTPSSVACDSSNAIHSVAPISVSDTSVAVHDALRPVLEQWCIKLVLAGGAATDATHAAASSDLADTAMAAVLNIYNTKLPS